MKACVAAALLALLSPVRITAQSSPDQTKENTLPPRSVGVLIGLDRLEKAGQPLPRKDNSADSQTQQNQSDNDEDSPVLRHSTPEQSPYITIWLQWTPASARIRLLRDIILPRKDGFWRFGVNNSGVEANGGHNNQDFFWLAPLGAKPSLTRAQDLGTGSLDVDRRLTYIGPDYFSYRESVESLAAKYSESKSGSLRSLDEFAKAPAEESYYDNSGISLTQILGSDAKLQFDKITEKFAPKSSDETDAETEPCATWGYQSSETDWYISHAQGRWKSTIFVNGGCDGSISADLAIQLTSKLVGHDPIPLAWDSVKTAFPGAQHAFSSPKGDWLVVLTRDEIYLAPVSGATIGKPASSSAIPYGIPVMAQWSLGKYVDLWDQQLSKVPLPNDDVILTHVNPADESVD